jgi:hypothetical protein
MARGTRDSCQQTQKLEKSRGAEMFKSTLALAVAAGVLMSQAHAEGFLQDSKATLKLRNYYINNDNRDSGTPNNANYSSEWGQGFQLEFQSGYTAGTVGFGVDGHQARFGWWHFR